MNKSNNTDAAKECDTSKNLLHSAHGYQRHIPSSSSDENKSLTTDSAVTNLAPVSYPGGRGFDFISTGQLS